jgi:hypothetical protein
MLAVQPMGPQLFSRTLAHEFCEFFYIDSWVMFLYSHSFRVVFLFWQDPASTVSSPLLSYRYNCRRFFILFFLNHIGKLHSTYVHPWACSKSSCFCTAIFVKVEDE